MIRREMQGEAGFVTINATLKGQVSRLVLDAAVRKCGVCLGTAEGTGTPIMTNLSPA